MKTIIKLKVNGNELEMGESVLSFDMINPMLNELSEYSLPFQIPVTEKNIEILGLEHDITILISSTNFDNVTLEFGFFTLTGIMIIEGSGTDNFLSGTFYSSRSHFFNLIKDKYLTDIVYSELINNTFDFVYSPTWLAKINDSAKHYYPDYNYVFAPVWMPNYGDEDLTGKIDREVVNKWDKVNDSFYYPEETGTTSQFAPYFYLCFVIKKLFNSYGLIITEDCLYDDEELRKLVVFHTNCENRTLPYADFSKHLPHILISDFILALEDRFNLRFIISQNNNVKIIFLQEAMTGDVKENITSISDPSSKISIDRFNGYLIPAQTNSDSNSSDANEQYYEIENSLLAVIVDNVSELSAIGNIIGDIALVKNKNEIYVWEYDINGLTNWEFKGSSFIDMKRNGNKILTIPESTVDLIMIEPVNNNISYLPVCFNERSRIIHHNIKKKKYEELTLLFYRGKVPYSAVESYSDLPAAPVEGDIYYIYEDDETYVWAHSSDPEDFLWYNVNNQPIEDPKNGNLGTMDINSYPLLTNSMYFRITDALFVPFPDSSHTLSLFGDKGLYVHYWEKYIYWMQNIVKKENRKLHLNESFLNNFEWDFIIRIQNQNYFISRIPMEIDFSKQTLSFKECELYSL